jgi:bifunctional DNA-binding transcriptional regulator/antitoxin component of YhaV-PrlF toxin-antitoxin module
LDGQITIPEGVRRLRDLADPAAIDDEKDRVLIIAFAREIPFIPNGDVRKLWAPYALEMKDEELARAEARWQKGFLEACKRIAEPYATDASRSDPSYLRDQPDRRA